MRHTIRSDYYVLHFLNFLSFYSIPSQKVMSLTKKKYTKAIVLFVIITFLLVCMYFLVFEFGVARQINYNATVFDVAFVISLEGLSPFINDHRQDIVLIAFNDGRILCRNPLLELLEKQTDFGHLDASFIDQAYENLCKTRKKTKFGFDDYSLFWVSSEIVLHCKQELEVLIKSNRAFLNKHSSFLPDVTHFRLYILGSTNVYSHYNTRLFRPSDQEFPDCCFNVNKPDIIANDEICPHKHGLLVLFWPVLNKLYENALEKKLNRVVVETTMKSTRYYTELYEAQTRVGFAMGKKGYISILNEQRVEIDKCNLFFIDNLELVQPCSCPTIVRSPENEDSEVETGLKSQEDSDSVEAKSE